LKKTPLPHSPKLLFLLDYDGTLADFTHNPEKSHLAGKDRALLNRLSRKFPVILVSGRYAVSLRKVSGLRSIPIAGTHGFESSRLPQGIRFATKQQEKRYRREALELWKAVKGMTRSFPGIHIEKKPFSSTLHYRGLDLTAGEEKALWQEYRKRFASVITPKAWELHPGKKMIEALPKGFSKAGAVAKILKAYPGYLPIIAGDDRADLLAMRVVGKKGLKIAVGNRIPVREIDLQFPSPPAFIRWLKNFTEF
jgi:trehalose-phosphatase